MLVLAMAMVDPDKIREKLDRDGLDEVRKKRAIGAYAKQKLPIVDEWLEQKQRELDAPTFMYHEFEAPEGREFKASEVAALEKMGFVDTPARFGKGFRSRSRRLWQQLRSFWLVHWKFIIATGVAIAGAVVAYVTG